MSTLARALELFDRLLDMPASAREAALAKETAGDPELARELRALLAADATRDPLLDGAGPALVADLLARELTFSGRPPPELPRDMPERIGPYRVLAPLGAGASGVVYEAEQEQPRRRVAIKTVRDRADSPDARRAFLAEAQALAALRHPVVPYVIEAGEWEHGLYIAMELVSGAGLRQALAKMGERPILELFLSLCEGVAHVHDGGWVHQDLKPSNVRLTADAEPKLLDFGLALSPDGTGRAGGTQSYMSPEQAEGAPGEPTADVYALGVMLFEALAGRLPVDCAGLSRVEAARAKRRPVTYPALPLQVEGLLRRCLSPEPGARYPTAAELAQDLRRLLEDRPVQGAPPSLPERGRLLVRRHRPLVTGLTRALGVGLLLAAGAAALDHARERERARAAQVSLEVLCERTEGLVRAGAPDQALAVFETWTGLPEVQGTAALTHGWLRHEALYEAAHPGGASEALAQAYASAPGRAARVEVLQALVEHFREVGRFDAMERALVALEALGAPGTDRAWAEALAGRRDLAAAADRLGPDSVGPVLRALSVGRGSGRYASVVTVASAETLWFSDLAADTLTLVDASPTFTPRQTWPVAHGDHLVPRGAGWGDPTLVLLYAPDEARSLRLARVEAGEPELRWASGALTGPFMASAAADPDGDGAPSLYWGTGAYSRGVFTLSEPGAEPQDAVVEADRGHSDVTSMVAGDFDGDGREELAVALGNWLARDVRVYQGSGAGLRVRASAPHHGELAALPHPDGGHWLVVSRGETDLPDAQEPGVYLYRLVGDTLRLDSFLSRPAHLRHESTGLLHGDLDGDGLVDLVLRMSSERESNTWVQHQVAPGRFEGLLLPAVEPILVHDLDGDGDQELVARLEVDGELWVLGTGDAPIPEAVATLSALPETPSGLRGPVVEAMELARLGLVEAAANLLASRADVDSDPENRAGLLLLAGRLAYAEGRVEDGLDLLTRSIELSDADDTRALAARWAAEVHDFARAQALLEAQGAPDATLFERVARALSLPQVTRWAQDVEQWNVQSPAGLRVFGDALEMDSYAHEGDLLSRAFDVQEGHLSFRTELDLDRLEPGASLHLGFREPDGLDSGAWQMVFRVLAWGGGGKVYYYLHCAGPQVTSGNLVLGPLETPGEAPSLRLRLSRDGDSSVCAFQVEGGESVTGRGDLTGIPWPSRLAWSVWLLRDPVQANAAMRGRLGVVELGGARPLPIEAGPWPEAARAWVRGAPLDHPDRLPVSPKSAELLAASGQADRVERWLRAQQGPPERVAAALRRDPVRWIPMARRAWPAAFERSYVEAWKGVLPKHPDDSEWMRLSLSELESLVVAHEDVSLLLASYARSLRDGGQRARAYEVARRCAERSTDAQGAGLCWAVVATVTEGDERRAACAQSQALVGDVNFRVLGERDPRLSGSCGAER